MDAGQIYNSWPLMGSSYYPDDSKFSDLLNLNIFNDPSIVQFIHRNLAYLIVIFYLYLLFFILRKKYKSLYVTITIIGISLSMQIILGVLTILSGVKIIYASLHQINSILIVLASFYFLYVSKNKETN